jgi:tetratricopeptide (TPR) repeat protein
MSDIFISYKREEQPIARKLADALEKEGFSVWWDPKLRAGEHFDDVIEKALSEAKCVIVIWSKYSVESPYVKDEATYALNRNKLVPVMTEQVGLPFRFEGVHTPRLVGWDGSRDFPEFRRLVDDISTIFGKLPKAAVEDSRMEKEEWQRQRSEEEASGKFEEASRRRNRWRTYGLVTAAVAVVLIIFSFAFWPKPQGADEKVIVLVANFLGPDPESYGVTRTVFNQLGVATEKYHDVEIQRLNIGIDNRKDAQIEGKKRKATLVLWGWYNIPGDVVSLSVHFEVLNPPKQFPQLGNTARGDMQRASIAELKNATIQTRLSHEMSYLSLFVLGMVRRAAGDGKGAIDRFSDALELAKKTEPSSSLNQSLVYFFRGVTYLFNGDFDPALSDLNQAIKLQPMLPEAYVDRSLIYIAQADYSHSLSDLNQALRLEPNSAVASNNRGMVYLQIKNYDQAIVDFTQALSKLRASTDSSKTIPPNTRQLGSINFDRDVPVVNFAFSEFSDYMVYINRGTAYLSKGDADRALTDFTEAIKVRPSYPFAYINRAAVYFKKGDYDQAIADLSQVIKLQPDFALAYMKRGVGYYFKGNTDRALVDLNQAIKLQPNSGVFYTTRGEVYAERGDHDQAIADFNQAIKLQADFQTYLDRGGSYLKKGDYDHAIADYNEAIKLKGDEAGFYNNRGWAYAQKGDFDHALEDLNQALKLKPDQASFYDTRALAYAGKRDYGQAMADYNQALKLKPDADYAYYGRGVVYRALGDQQKAIADFKKTLELTKDSKRYQDAQKQLQELGTKGLTK